MGDHLDDVDQQVAALTSAAERLDALADTADLMGDRDGADRLRSSAWSRRMEAMALLDG
jgi:hypothetical protein